MKAKTSDIGLAIKDACVGEWINVIEKVNGGPGTRHINERKIVSIDADDPHNPIVMLDNGQRFVVRIISIE